MEHAVEMICSTAQFYFFFVGLVDFLLPINKTVARVFPRAHRSSCARIYRDDATPVILSQLSLLHSVPQWVVGVSHNFFPPGSRPPFSGNERCVLTAVLLSYARCVRVFPPPTRGRYIRIVRGIATLLFLGARSCLGSLLSLFGVVLRTSRAEGPDNVVRGVSRFSSWCSGLALPSRFTVVGTVSYPVRRPGSASRVVPGESVVEILAAAYGPACSEPYAAQARGY
ncbi:hypothetical protein BJY52DRAFT_412191 [Lactarius psammicola]|nr:hypothetical protein BJY52DRAFT_412191 [Lactarius psammicola]